MQGFDSQAPCLCCNTMVLIRSQDWGPKVAALCIGCYGFLPLQLIQILYILRCQIGVLHMQQAEAQRDIKRLFSAQQDVEQKLLNKG